MLCFFRDILLDEIQKWEKQPNSLLKQNFVYYVKKKIENKIVVLAMVWPCACLGQIFKYEKWELSVYNVTNYDNYHSQN